MKIAVIASSAERLQDLTEVLEQRLLEDQFVLLKRQEGELRLDRVGSGHDKRSHCRCCNSH